MKTVTLPPGERGNQLDLLRILIQSYEPNRPINVRISIARPERTPPQLRYLWGVAYEMLSETAGYEKEDIHEYLCMAHFGKKVKRLPGNRSEEVPIRTTTEDEDGNRDVIDGEEFWKYVSFVQRFGARHGVVIPDPSKDYKIGRV